MNHTEIIPELKHADDAGHLILNLGCGRHQPPGKHWANVDNAPLGPNVLHLDVAGEWYLPESFFDVIYASHVLEHLPPPSVGGKDPLFRVMEQAHRVLEPRGRFIIRVPDARYPGGQAFAHPQHYRRFTPLTFQYLANQLQENWYHYGKWVVERVQCRPWAYRGGNALRVRGLGAFTHACERVKPLGKIMAKDGEIIAVLRVEKTH